jgi:hypothetical protein
MIRVLSSKSVTTWASTLSTPQSASPPLLDLDGDCFRRCQQSIACPMEGSARSSIAKSLRSGAQSGELSSVIAQRSRRPSPNGGQQAGLLGEDDAQGCA